MFRTFRHINSENRRDILESVLPPFDRKRQGKLTRVACIHCRSKKLKCTGERNGCRRCRLKKLDCTYPRPSSSKSLSKTKDQERTSHTDRHPLAAGNHAGTAYIREPIVTNSVMMEGFADGNHKLDQMGTLDVANYFLWNESSPDEAHNPDTNTIDYLTQDASFFSIPCFRDSQPDSEKAHGAGCTPEPAFKTGTNSKSTPCSCLRQILRTFETVQLATALGLQDASEAFYSNARNTLCVQKDALASCETLLECPMCSSQSEHITMVTYINDKMLTSIRDLVSASSMTRSVAYKDGLIGSQSGSYSDPRDTGLEIKRWKLDNEDEMQAGEDCYGTPVVLS
ncbi:hypothetical protein BDV27DRAFT_153931 [Aspergillus caelatus]|uniref:Zn(2)-C6 fungal-type domain-containing protein n=1 Tax=Aspergillus caelatus TaxID=61420 RepID=A0A5N7AFA5_9EURO|nr:uncharacterized protein BDV27DRAFT_153931 [Aspergillus caelatus]KAE8368551.1 hypothetical protein BDV27DRAFT_153931 [Aspergillus caelatus]